MQFITRGTLMLVGLLALSACGTSDEPASTPTTSHQSPAAAAPAAPAPAATSSASSTTVTPASTDEPLKAAVTKYSDAFLGAEPVEAYELLSKRCQQQVSLSYFTGIIIAAKEQYGRALPLRSFKADISASKAKVTYTYDVPALDQKDEPWVLEASGWKNDECDSE